jgi:hypothetical protein
MKCIHTHSQVHPMKCIHTHSQAQFAQTRCNERANERIVESNKRTTSNAPDSTARQYQSPTQSPKHTITHPLTRSNTHALTHTPTQSLTHSLTHPLTHSPTHPLAHSPSRPLTHSISHSSPTHLPLAKRPSSLHNNELLACTDGHRCTCPFAADADALWSKTRQQTTVFGWVRNGTLQTTHGESTGRIRGRQGW